MKIKGSKTADVLTGTDGDDIIKGSKGSDTIVGGDGFDILYGGKGRDTFIIKAGDFDAIADFQSDKDKIIIEAGLYGGGAGSLQIADYVDYSAPFLSYEGAHIAVIPGVPALSEGDVWLS